MDVPDEIAQLIDEHVEKGLADRLISASSMSVVAGSSTYVTRLAPEETRFLEERAEGLRTYAKMLYGKQIDLSPELYLRLLVQKAMEEAGWH